jgi:oxalate decarboxylase/phosphoglucose isomerase-like protein (cupin superfamily)
MSKLDKNNESSPTNFHLQTSKAIKAFVAGKGGMAHVVDRDNFPVLNGVTCYTLELWEECMRIPHWHPNSSELGYVISGTIEIMIWRSPGESAMFTLGAGMCWFIPKGALHALMNVGTERAKLLVGFGNDKPQDMDLPVAFNGIPAPVRDAYTSPHVQLREWEGVTNNPLLGHCPVQSAVRSVTTGSPYGFDFAKVTPLYNDGESGSVTWGVKSNWSILENISILRAHLKPGVARDAIWYPDAGTLYVVSKGKAEFTIVMAGQAPLVFNVELYDFIYVPEGVLHTFTNTGDKDFEVVAFFTKADPLAEVSLSVATAFFPNTVRKAALMHFTSEHKVGDPLRDLRFTDGNPYLLEVCNANDKSKPGSPHFDKHKIVT